ncbi:MAG: roadblock/LC7 domain-containing protein [Anaerolineae bacterium]|nr:roadblock/LC7 domain-containing protein [Anaerolineae bacterium]
MDQKDNLPQHAQSNADLAAQALEAGIRAARNGKKRFARRLLAKATELDPLNETAWLWLASVAETSADSLVCLQTVLALNPNNRQAREGLRWVRRDAETGAEVDAIPGGKARADTARGGKAKVDEARPRAGKQVCPRCGTVMPAGASDCPICTAVNAWPVGELTPSFILSVEQAEAIDACLETMAQESEARYIILADISGQLIAEQGQSGSLNTQVLSALAAGELAATHELARLVGEEARFKLLLHEGKERSVYLSDLGEQLILLIVFDNDTPIGLVRTVLKQALEELEPILAAANREGQRAGATGALGDDFAQLIESELDSSLEL